MALDIALIKFLKKLSLMKQLLLVFFVLAILDIAVLMPVVDYNMHEIIDRQQYQQLKVAQNNASLYEQNPKAKVDHIFTYTYNSKTQTLTFSNFPGPFNLSEEFAYLVVGKSLSTIITDQKHQIIESKGTFNDKTFYFRIKQSPEYNYKYYISILSSEYSEQLLLELTNRIIYIQYAFLILTAFIMILWGLSLIRPLRKIKTYIEHIKNRDDASLNIKRYDEIGLVAHSLVDMKENLDKQEKAKEEMIHNISHDLKTPIALIKSYGQSVKDDIYPYGDKNSSMDIILENADRLEHKVKTLLYLNRLDYIDSKEKSLTPFPMKDLIEHIVSQMRTLNNIQIETKLEDVSFIGHEEHWRVAIENIIDNASRYAKSLIKITLKKDYLSIYNDGDKIDEDKLEDLFSPYVKGVKGQFGLGLSIVSKTAQMYGYKIIANNEKEGVSFTFTKI